MKRLCEGACIFSSERPWISDSALQPRPKSRRIIIASRNWQTNPQHMAFLKKVVRIFSARFARLLSFRVSEHILKSLFFNTLNFLLSKH